MSRFLSIFLVAGLMFSCATEQKKESSELHFKIEGAANDSLMIGYYYGNKEYVLGKDGKNDVIHLDENGEGTYGNDSLQKGVYLAIFLPQNEYGEFIYDGEALNITANREDLPFTMTAKNSLSNELKHEGMQIIKKMSAARQDAGNGKDSPLIDSLNMEYSNFVDRIMKEHPENLYVKMTAMGKEPVVPEDVQQKGEEAAFYYYRDHYLDHIPFDKKWALRSPMYQRTLDTYLQSLTYPNVDSINAAVDNILDKSKANDEVYKYNLMSLLNTYANSKTMGHDAVYVHIAKKYYLTGKAPWVAQENLDKIATNVNQLQSSLVGMKAKNFDIIESTGKEYSLYDVQSPFTVLFLMDPDCEHCQNAAQQFKDAKGQIPSSATILAVAFNTKLDKLNLVKKERNYYWKMGIPQSEAIADSIGKDYNITTFPQIYVLDKDKTIIAKQVLPSQIQEVIKTASK